MLEALRKLPPTRYATPRRGDRAAFACCRPRTTRRCRRCWRTSPRHGIIRERRRHLDLPFDRRALAGAGPQDLDAGPRRGRAARSSSCAAAHSEIVDAAALQAYRTRRTRAPSSPRSPTRTTTSCSTSRPLVAASWSAFSVATSAADRGAARLPPRSALGNPPHGPSQRLPRRARRAHARADGAGAAGRCWCCTRSSRADLWAPYHDALAARFHVIAPDHPGFGDSERPDWLDDVDDLVFHYVDLLDALAIERVSIVGTSLGGWIAAAFAVAHPERVDRLVLAAPAGIKVDGVERYDYFANPIEETLRHLFHDPTRAAQILPTEYGAEVVVRAYHEFTTLARLSWNPYLLRPQAAAAAAARAARRR